MTKLFRSLELFLCFQNSLSNASLNESERIHPSTDSRESSVFAEASPRQITTDWIYCDTCDDEYSVLSANLFGHGKLNHSLKKFNIAENAADFVFFFVDILSPKSVELHL